jgi:CBS domain-containing protein
MNVAKIMRKDVVALRAAEGIEAAWRQMRVQKLGTLPVTDTVGRLVGVLSEHDLLVRLAPRREPGWWRAIAYEDGRLAAEYVKAVAVTVGDLMTAPPVAIVPDAALETAARLMRRHAIGALPVVVKDLCVGLVTRADVLDHLSWPAAAVPGTVSDVALECLMQERLQQELWTSRHGVTVGAAHAVIRLTGIVACSAERSALVAMARSIPGCAGVEDRLLVGGAGLRRPLKVI